MYDLFCKCVTVCKNVLEVDSADKVEVLLETVIDKVLEGGGCIGETKHHDRMFQVAVSGARNCFLFFS